MSFVERMVENGMKELPTCCFVTGMSEYVKHEKRPSARPDTAVGTLIEAARAFAQTQNPLKNLPAPNPPGLLPLWSVPRRLSSTRERLCSLSGNLASKSV